MNQIKGTVNQITVPFLIYLETVDDEIFCERGKAKAIMG
jgi:hypothetical protein